MHKPTLYSALFYTALIILTPAPGSAQPAPPPQDAPQANPSQPAPSTPAMEQSVRQLLEDHKKLKQRIEELEQKNSSQEIKQLQLEAEAATASNGEAIKQAEEEENLKEQTFRGGQRALQALNPEISVVGDGFGKLLMGPHEYTSEGDRSGFVFRMVGLHFQADLDPFSFTKITVGITPSGVGLGEAYMTWTSILPGLSLTAGKFRQEFGVVNRWHVPSLDQVDFPLALREVLGGDGLNQIGLSFEYLLPRLWAHTNHVVLQVTNGQNDRLFAGKYFSIPSILLRLKSYYDLSESTYFELGLTGMVGWNNHRGVTDETGGELVDQPWRETWLWGVDWTLMWEPLKQAKYKNFMLRGELYGVRKNLPDNHISTVGLYQQVQGKIARSWELGARFDWTTPFAVDNQGQHTFGLQPYLTWWQSPWVRVRALYAWTTSDSFSQDDHRLLLQVTFAAGPHKHERY